jgi:hypothetical protein
VFLADIQHAGAESEEVRPNVWAFVPQPVRFRVLEAFKGVRVETRQLDAWIKSGSAEAILFRTGKQYLVYATRERDGIWSTVCSRTTLNQQINGKNDEPIAQELRELRNCHPR